MIALEQITKISIKKKLLVLIGSVLVVGVAFWFIYYSPMQYEYEKLKKTYAKLQNDKQDATRRKAVYDQDRTRRDELKASYGQQIRALPADTEISSFLNSLNTQAELVGLDIISVKPRKEEPAQYYARIPIELKLNGSFHQLAKFFYLVGNLDRIINIENIVLNTSQTADSGTILSAEVLATTFRALEEEPPKETQKTSNKKGKK